MGRNAVTDIRTCELTGAPENTENRADWSTTPFDYRLPKQKDNKGCLGARGSF